MHTLFSQKTPLKILSVFGILLLLCLVLVPKLHHASATGSFTASNVTFDPTTGKLSFVSNLNLSGAFYIEDAGLTTKYWTYNGGQQCSGSISTWNCYANLEANVDDTGVTQVKIYTDSGGGYASQTLTYPFPYPTTYTEQNPTAGGGWVTSSVLADGSVTDAKISDDSSQTSRVQTWTDNTTDNKFNAYGSFGVQGSITSGISVTVPTGKAYYYVVTYDGTIQYNSSEAANSSSTYYGAWDAQLLANSTTQGILTNIVLTPNAPYWSSISSGTWYQPYHATWLVRLTAGTYTLGMQISGYSNNTMNYAHFLYNNLQAMRVF